MQTLSYLFKFAKPARWCFMQICPACSPVHTLFYASQVRRACQLVLLANLSGLLARSHSLLGFADSLSFLASASCTIVGPSRSCTPSFTLRKFSEPPRSCFLQIDRTCSPVHTLSYAFQVRQACSLVLLANRSNLLARAHSLLSFASLPNLLAHASLKSVANDRPCTISFMHRKSGEPASSYFLQICRACSPLPTLFYASQVRRAFSFMLLENLLRLLAPAQSLLLFVRSPNLLPRAFCKSAGPSRSCTLSFTIRKFAEPARSCFLQICPACSPVHTFLKASQVRRAFSLMLLENLLRLLAPAQSLLLFVRSPNLLPRAF
ncbi:hypothetical protein CRG98_013253 [Punica granatum]|uniref:Uncharacterized protein n=1 Tax=Punica granatum TaxID=22663 RepID=A0A2I0KCV3_PUNGR|nr:hypothetical protein CRG98_013253 [Punica granatum]